MNEPTKKYKSEVHQAVTRSLNRVLREVAGGVQAELARMLGVSPGTLTPWLKGESLPGGESLVKLNELGYSADDIFGFKKPSAPKAVDDPDSPQVLTMEGEDYALVPRYNVTANLGNGQLLPAQEMVIDKLAFKLAWLRGEMGLALNRLALIDVTGNSMEPQLRSGDMVLVDQGQDRVAREGIYCLLVDREGLVCKYCSRMPGGTIRVMSLNPEYQRFDFDFTPDADEYPRVIGRVVWLGRVV